MASRTIRCERVYDSSAAEESYRVLVDRLWPRGIKKVDLALDAWAKELAPSTELRRWYNHDEARWAEFQRRYEQELAPQRDALETLLRSGEGDLVLLFSSRARERNSAQVLRRILMQLQDGA